MINKLNSLLLGVLLMLAACSSPQPAANEPAAFRRPTTGSAPASLDGLAVATFAGGCFWCEEEIFEELRGVQQVVSGYAGGPELQPTYEQVGSGATGHAESVEVYYDPKQISYQTLLDVFFVGAHDPTTLNRQGPDAGTQYRSIAFYRTPQEKQLIEATIRRVDSTHHYPDPIVTQVRPLTRFWPAEEYHQGYYRLHPDDSYIRQVSGPKVAKFRRAFPDKLKQD